MRRAPYEIKVWFGLTKRVGVDTVKREAIRRCRAMTKYLGAGGSGEVRVQGLGLIYQCHATLENGRVVLRVDEL